ncbi:MAG: AP endonuclease, partial [Firmicutes bacterium]|nr:AP endonuclease [Bacillota bacterium]
MKELFSIPYDNYMIDHYGGAEGLEAMVKESGCDGIEWVWGGEPVTREMPKNIVNGYHLTFFNDWLDYYLGNTAAVEERFGHNGKWKEFYRGEGADDLVKRYRFDLEQAIALGAPYTVFHASDVSIEETYTYRWNHTDREVIDAVVDVINRVYGKEDLGPALLLENLWWPGFR